MGHPLFAQVNKWESLIKAVDDDSLKYDLFDYIPVESRSLEERQQAYDYHSHVNEGGEGPRLVEPVRPRLLPLRHKVDVPAVDGVVEVRARQHEHLLLLRRGHSRVVTNDTCSRNSWKVGPFPEYFVVTLQMASCRFLWNSFSFFRWAGGVKFVV